MRTATVDITLLQPAVFSLQSGSAGAHRGLDYIPGSTLLGHTASRLYAELSEDDAWTVFHSGRVRFGDGLPLLGLSPSAPMPLCWHAMKGGSAAQLGRLIRENLFDPSLEQGNESRQPVQIRSGYVTESGDLVMPPRVQTLKTAIDPESGRAADGQLFGYEAIAAGQRFRALLQSDADVPDDLWNRILAAMEGRARLGRSRSAQYGSVEMRVDSAPDVARSPVATTNELTLWLLSDLALETAGQPSLAPHPGSMGLPNGSRWLPEASFLRPRSYSPYNAYRRHHDSERQVIARGSVLRFALPGPLDAATVEVLEAGIGLFIESGLGRVAINPPMLSTSPPRFAGAKRQSESRSSASARAAATESAFARGLKARHERLHGTDLDLKARELHHQYNDVVERALRYDSFSERPKASQWGRLKQLASDHRHDPAALMQALFDKDSGALRPRRGTGWDIRYGTDPEDTLAGWMREKLVALEPGVGGARLGDVLGQWAAMELHRHESPSRATSAGNVSRGGA